MLLGQGEVAAWTGIIGTVANIGFSGLVGWYLLTKGIPKIQEEFSKALENQQAHFDKTEQQRRDENAKALQAVVQHCESESKRRDDIARYEMAIVNKSIVDVGEVMEEVRDELRARKPNA